MVRFDRRLHVLQIGLLQCVLCGLTLEKTQELAVGKLPDKVPFTAHITSFKTACMDFPFISRPKSRCSHWWFNGLNNLGPKYLKDSPCPYRLSWVGQRICPEVQGMAAWEPTAVCLVLLYSTASTVCSLLWPLTPFF